MFLIEGFVSGIIATIIFDLFQGSLSYAYEIKKPSWNLVGRFFAGLLDKKYFRANIENEDKVKYELIIGYLIHYIIGIIFGVIYIILNLIFYDSPSYLIAILFGFFTVLGAWCIMMPFAYNIGFFASKKDNQKQILTQNLIAHFIFGSGLYIGYLIIY